MAEKKLRPENLVPPPGGSGIQRRPPEKLEVEVRRDGGDRVWAQVSRKVRLAKYESLEVGCGSTVSVNEGETLSDALKRVGAVVREEFAELLEVLREDAEV